MDKSKLASIGERLKSGGAQMSRMVTLKVQEIKDLLQSPTPESRIVDQSTSPTLDSPDWGLNLRICSLINAEELNGAEIVKSIKRKFSNGGDFKVVSLALELLEACAMNCEKVFSEIASEKVVEEMVVKLIQNREADRECQVRAMELIRAWGESEDLNYLPIFRQTYENLKRSMNLQIEDGTYPSSQYTLESYLDQHPGSAPENYPIPTSDSNGASGMNLPYTYGSLSTEQKKEFLEITKNSLEVLSSLLNSSAESNVTEDELTISMLDKCKESHAVVQRIVQDTNDDEGLLFEALNLNDELQKVISKFDEMQVSVEPNIQQPIEPKDSNSETRDSNESTEPPRENTKHHDVDLLSGVSPSETQDSNKLMEPTKLPTENAKHDAVDLLSGGSPSESRDSNKSLEPPKVNAKHGPESSSDKK